MGDENIPYCKKCGKELSEDVKFCPKCGTRVSETSGKSQRGGYVREEPSPEPSMGLEPGEEVLWSGKPSRLGFIGWYVGLFFLTLIISVLVGVAGGGGAGVFAFFLFSIIFFGIVEKWLQGHKFLVTTQRAIREVDWFGRSVETIDLYNATDVEYDQGWLQKMHNYGNVSILTPGTA